MICISLGMPAANCSEQTTALSASPATHGFGHGNKLFKVRPIKVRPPLKFHFGKYTFVPPPQAPPGGYVNVKQYGATGNGVTDDSNAILAAISAAQGISTGVFFPAGNYVTSVYLTSSVPLVGAGSDSVLSASAGQLVLQGNGVGLSNMVIVGQQGVTIRNANNFTVSQVTVLNCQNGLTIENSNNGVIKYVSITSASNTALAIQDSNYIQVFYNNLSASGPNTLQTANQAQSSSLSGLTVAYNQIWGTVAMGTVNSCVFDYNTLTGGTLIFGCQTNPQTTTPMNGVEIIGNYVNASGWNQPVGIWIANYYEPNSNSTYPPPNYVSTVDTIQIANNHVSNTATGIGVAGVNNCSITSNAISNTTTPIFATGYCNCSISNNYINGALCTATFFSPTNYSTIQFFNNQISNCCTGTNNNSVILCLPANYVPPGNLAIYSNSYTGPLNKLQYFVDDEFPGAQSNPNIYGNTDSYMLPNKLAP
jgi:hypothetical protein